MDLTRFISEASTAAQEYSNLSIHLDDTAQQHHSRFSLYYPSSLGSRQGGVESVCCPNGHPPPRSVELLKNHESGLK